MEAKPQTAVLAEAWTPSIPRALSATLLGGLVGMFAFHFSTPIYEYQAIKELPLNATAEQFAAFQKAHIDYYALNYAYEMGLTGLCLGLAIGAIATTRKRLTSTLLGGLAGLVTGAIAGYLAGFPTGYAMAISTSPNLVMSTVYQVAIWGTLCGLIGFAIGVIQCGFPEALRALLAGVLGGTLAAVVMMVVFSFAFPFYDLMYFVPNLPTSASMDSELGRSLLFQRLTWAITGSLIFGLLLSIGLQPRAAPNNASNGVSPENTEVLS